MDQPNKTYLDSTEQLTESSKNGDKIFIEFRNVHEEIENANKFEKNDWEFMIKTLTNISGKIFRFFKIT